MRFYLHMHANMCWKNTPQTANNSYSEERNQGSGKQRKETFIFCFEHSNIFWNVLERPYVTFK